MLSTFFHFDFSGKSDRDVFNEKPLREEILAASQARNCLVLFFFVNFYLFLLSLYSVSINVEKQSV